MILVATMSSIIFSLTTIALPILIGMTVDMMLGVNNVDFDQVINLIIAMLGVIVVMGAFGWLTGMAANTLAFKTTGRLRKSVFSKVNSLPVWTIDNTSNGDFIARGTTDIEFISDGLVQTFMEAISGITAIIGTIVIMCVVNWVLALVVIILTPLSMITAGVVAGLCRKVFRARSEKFGEMAGYTEEIIGEISVVKCFDINDRVQDKFSVINNEMKRVGVKAQFAAAMINPSARIVNNLVYALVGVTGSILALKQVDFGSTGVVTAGILTTFLMYASQYTKPFNTLSNVVSELQMALSSAVRVFNLLDEQSEEDEHYKLQTIDTESKFEFENVQFGYSQDKILFTDLDLTVEKGQKVAIVGKTGSGKTTIINLIMRFYEVNNGSIKIGGVDIRDIDRRVLRSKIGMVLQDTWLCSGTIRENIAYGKPNATIEEIVEVAKQCNIHNFISRLDDGYDTVISKGGANLSAGQRQLLCIARVMLADNEILILDEATSNIDTRTEMHVQTAFTQMMQGKTTFIVAHRLSTIKSADVILVVDDGDIVEQGTFDELMNRKGYYYNLYNSQYNE